MKKKIILLVFILFMITPLFSDDGYLFGLDFTIGNKTNFEFDAGVVGGSIKWLAFNPIGFELDYLYLGKDYYTLTNGVWSYSDSLDSSISESDWLFYQTYHLLSPSIILALGLGDLELHAGLGLSFAFMIPSEALRYYTDPGFLYEENSNAFSGDWGTTIKLGAEYHLFGIFSVGFDYLFIGDSLGKFIKSMEEKPVQYFLNKGNVMFTVGVRL